MRRNSHYVVLLNMPVERERQDPSEVYQPANIPRKPTLHVDGL